MEHERLAILHDILRNYVKHMIFGFEIKRVQVLCKLHDLAE